ncbi:MAG TPA: hypothetical protein VIT45_08230 [Allosphingosinicella sp.]
MATQSVPKSRMSDSLAEKTKDKIVIAATGAVVAAIVTGLLLLLTGFFARLVVPENAIMLVTGDCERGWKPVQAVHGKYVRLENPKLSERTPLTPNDRVRAASSPNYYLDYGKAGDRRSQQIQVVDTVTPIAPDFYALTACQKRSY